MTAIGCNYGDRCVYPRCVDAGCDPTVAAGVMAAGQAQQFTRDFPADNGLYMHRCCKCNEIFHGHKRRVVCAACAGTKDSA